MKCPLKFSRYEFEGGTDCIGAECGFYGSVCDMDMSVSVQKCLNELPEGDAVKELREFIDDQFVSGKTAWTQGMAIADMVERDYVSREYLDEVRSEADYREGLLHESIDDLKAERDEWKAKVKTLAGYSNYWRGRCAKLEHRSDKRAAAVERLRMLDEFGGGSFEYAILGSDKMTWSYMDKRDALIDLLTDDDAHSKAQSITESNLTEQSEFSSDESDSREKLEEDVRQILHSAYMLAWMHGHENRRGSSFEKLHREFYNLLDRQAAITERETTLRELYKFEKNHREHIDSIEEVNRELNRRIAELTEQLEAAHAKNRALKAHISKMQQGRHGWHVKGVELQRQVDELTAQLHASSAERARLRECLGIATDNAHDFLTLVDESGNVYDRDEGLA